MTISITKANTSNPDQGLIIATDVIHSVETISIVILAKVGSRDEQESQSGISHFLEHMAFKGTTSRTALKIAEEFDEIGGYFNAYTSRERTVYYAKVLKEDLKKACNILSDILQNSLYAEHDIIQESDVILQEIAQNNDSPDDLVFDMLYQQAFDKQQFGKSILGDEAVVENMSHDALINFINQHYSYQNIIIAAAGNCNHQEFCDIIQTSFTKLSNNPSPPRKTPLYINGDIRLKKDLEQVHIALAFQGVSYLSSDFYTQQVLSIILGGGMSSRLFQEVREKRGLAYNISSFTSSYCDVGLFGIYTSTSEDKVNTMLDVIAAELSKITQAITQDELNRAKAQVRASLLMGQESTGQRAERLASNIAALQRYLSNQELLEKIEEIDQDALITFAQKTLSTSKPTIASIGKVDTLYNYNDMLKLFAYT